MADAAPWESDPVVGSSRGDAAPWESDPAVGASQDAPWESDPVLAHPSAGGAFLRAGERGAVPAVGSMAAMGAGAALGAPLGPIGAVAGAVAGGLGGGYLVGKAQDAILRHLPESWQRAIGQDEETQRADISEHPYASMIGELAPNLLMMRPGAVVKAAEDAPALIKAISGPVSSRAVGAGFGAAQELAQEETSGDDFDPGRLAIAAGAGAAMNRETGLGRRVAGYGEGLGARAAQRYAGAGRSGPGDTGRQSGPGEQSTGQSSYTDEERAAQEAALETQQQAADELSRRGAIPDDEGQQHAEDDVPFPPEPPHGGFDTSWRRLKDAPLFEEDLRPQPPERVVPWQGRQPDTGPLFSGNAAAQPPERTVAWDARTPMAPTQRPQAEMDVRPLADPSATPEQAMPSGGDEQALREAIIRRDALEQGQQESALDVSRMQREVFGGNGRGNPAPVTPPEQPDTAQPGMPAPAEEQTAAELHLPWQTVAQAAADVRDMRTALPPDPTLLETIRGRGGIKITDGKGNISPEGQTLISILGGRGPAQYRGLVNNRSGRTADYVREYLNEDGWFGGAPRPDTDLNDLWNLIDSDIRAGGVYHPTSDVAPLRETRAALDQEMTDAGIRGDEDPGTQTRMLAAYRHEQDLQQSAFDALRDRADAMGVPHHANSDYDELRAKVEEREAIMAGQSHEDDDIHDIERDIRSDLSRTEAPTVADGEPGEASGSGAAARGLGSESVPGEAPGRSGPQAGAGGEGAGTAPGRDYDPTIDGDPLDWAFEQRRRADGYRNSGTGGAAPKGWFDLEPGATDARGNPLPQGVLPGMERSAQQAAAAREASGRGRIQSPGAQASPGGLFAERGPREPEMFGEAPAPPRAPLSADESAEMNRLRTKQASANLSYAEWWRLGDLEERSAHTGPITNHALAQAIDHARVLQHTTGHIWRVRKTGDGYFPASQGASVEAHLRQHGFVPDPQSGNEAALRGQDPWDGATWDGLDARRNPYGPAKSPVPLAAAGTARARTDLTANADAYLKGVTDPVARLTGAASYLHLRGQKTGHEALAVLDPVSGHVRVHTTNEPDHVGWNPDALQRLRDGSNTLVTVHNHPVAVGPSSGDVATTLMPGHHTAIVVDGGGHWYAVRQAGEVKPNGNYGAAVWLLREAGTRAHMRIARAIQNRVDAGDITSDEAFALDQHVVNLGLERAGVTRYQTSYSIPAAHRDWAEPLIGEATHAINETLAGSHDYRAGQPVDHAAEPVRAREGFARVLEEARQDAANAANRTTAQAGGKRPGDAGLKA